MGKCEYVLGKEAKEEILDRLCCIEGHIRGIEKMVDGDSGSLKVVQQMGAVQGALEKVNSLVVREYLDNWSEDINSPGETIDELQALERLILLFAFDCIAQQPQVGEGVSFF